MSANELTHITGTFLIQAEGAFLNGAGLDSGEDRNAVIPKTYWDIDDKGRRVRVPYVSAQAWRRWLRLTFQEENPNEPAAEIVEKGQSAKGTTNKIGTEMNPIVYVEDDIFGYMRAEKEQGKAKKSDDAEDGETPEGEDEAANTSKKKTEKTKAVMRPSPFVSSILKSIRKDASVLSDDEGFVHLKEGSPLPYKTKFYNTQLQGIFGLNYARLGVFRNDGDRIELDESFAKQYLAEGAIRRKNGSESQNKSDGKDIYEMTENKRRERATMILKALSVLRGGAKQAQFGTDVAPKVLIIAGLNCGNLIFNDIFTEKEGKPIIKIDSLRQILADYKDRLATPVYIGFRKGYLHPQNETELMNLQSDGAIEVTSPIEAVNKLTEQLNNAS